MLSNTFVFRNVRTQEELQALLHLRYQVYLANHVRHFIKENECQMDFDGYDLRARHFGLFKNDIEPMGYIRVVSEQPSPQSELIVELVKCYPELHVDGLDQKDAPLPLMAYHPDAERLLKLYENCRAKDEIIVEPGRLVISPEYQSLKLVQHLVKSAIAVYFYHLKVCQAWLCCASHHVRLYEHFGFQKMKDTGECIVFTVPYFALYSSPAQVPEQLQTRFIEMAQEYRYTNTIRYQTGKSESNIILQPTPAKRHSVTLAVA